MTKRKLRIQGLAREPLVFCQSDPHPNNFIVADSGSITAIDFSEASIVPSSFARYFQLDEQLAQKVVIPQDEMHNVYTLMDLGGMITIGSVSFVQLGKIQPGGDKEAQARMLYLGSPEEESDECT